MEPSRFDALSRRLATPGNRRGFLKTIASVFAGAAVATVLVEEAEALACRPGLQSCTKGSQCCSGTCNDARHPDRALRSKCACGPGTAYCNGTCRNFLNDVTNCGGCGVACPDGSGDACIGVAVCQAGVCGFAPVADGTACSDNDPCTVGDTCRAGTCVPGPVLTCDQLPNASGACVDGACVVTGCYGLFGDCNGIAADGCETYLQPDSANCGACGNACVDATGNDCLGAGYCNSGACYFPSLPNGTSCDDGNACTQSATCDGAGTCVGGTQTACQPLDACHDAGTCDPVTGQCSNPAKADDTPCGGGNVCMGGSCVPNTCPSVCPSDLCVEGDAGAVCFRGATTLSDNCEFPCETQADCTNGGTCTNGLYVNGRFYATVCAGKSCARP